MTVMKRSGSKYWMYEFRFDGERYRGSTKQTNKKAAQDVERKVLEDLKARKRGGFETSIILGEAVEAYGERYARRTRSGRQIQVQVAARVKHLGADRVFDDLDTDDVIGMFDRMVENGYSEYTAGLYTARLGAVINWFAESKPKVARPTNIAFPKAKRPRRERVLTLDEEQAVLDQLDPDLPIHEHTKLRYLIDTRDVGVMLADTGARISEAVSATWDMVLWDRDMLRLYRIKTDSWSNIPLSSRMADMLRRREELTEGSPYIFPNQSTNPRSTSPHKSTEMHALERAIDRAGVNAPHLVDRYGKVTLHTYRHTFITRLAEKGIDPWTLQEVAGHAHLSTTLGYVQNRRIASASVKAALAGSPQLVSEGEASPYLSPRYSGRTKRDLS